MLSSFKTHACVRVGVVTHTIQACLEIHNKIQWSSHARRFLTNVRSRESQLIQTPSQSPPPFSSHDASRQHRHHDAVPWSTEQPDDTCQHHLRPLQKWTTNTRKLELSYSLPLPEPKPCPQRRANSRDDTWFLTNTGVNFPQQQDALPPSPFTEHRKRQKIGFNSKQTPDTKNWNDNSKKWVRTPKISVQVPHGKKWSRTQKNVYARPTRRSYCNRPTTLTSRTNTEQRK